MAITLQDVHFVREYLTSWLNLMLVIDPSSLSLFWDCEAEACLLQSHIVECSLLLHCIMLERSWSQAYWPCLQRGCTTPLASPSLRSCASDFPELQRTAPCTQPATNLDKGNRRCFEGQGTNGWLHDCKERLLFMIIRPEVQFSWLQLVRQPCYVNALDLQVNVKYRLYGQT